MNNFEIYELKLKIFRRDQYQCQGCGESILIYGTPQLAHRISKDKVNLKKYGPEIIHHPENLKSTCSLACNALFDLGGKTVLIEALVNKIKHILNLDIKKNNNYN